MFVEQSSYKARFAQLGIFTPIPSMRNFINKKNLEIEKTKPMTVTSVLKIDITTSNFFITQ